MNTKIEYLYRDADNYKMWNSVVVRGEITDKQKQKIAASLLDGEFFIPRCVGLPETRFSEWDEQSDHDFFELRPESAFSFTEQQPTLDISAADLSDRFVLYKKEWHKLAVL